MFFCSTRKRRRQVGIARRALHLAKKVYRYRRDVLSVEVLQTLNDATEALRAALRNNGAGNESALNIAMEDMDRALQRSGGTFYPRPAWAENVEMFLVAAILAIGIRFYFFQPFKIPTNSMYPTYHGMTYEAYAGRDALPSSFERWLRRARLWATPYRITASRAGRVRIPIHVTKVDRPKGAIQVFIDFDEIIGRRWGVLPARQREYHFFKPRSGDPFVFRTGKISGIGHRGRVTQDQYYIKRLAGEPKDILSIRDGTLYRNGKPAVGAQAFIDNADGKGEYAGYLPAGNLSNNEVRVPLGHYYALGDNSDESSDSRFWGWVPERELVGKALFIFYPFSWRWGPAH